LDPIADVAVSVSRYLNLKLRSREIIFEIHILCDHGTWTSQADRQTNRQTDGRQCAVAALCVYSAVKAFGGSIFSGVRSNFRVRAWWRGREREPKGGNRHSIYTVLKKSSPLVYTIYVKWRVL